MARPSKKRRSKKSTEPDPQWDLFAPEEMSAAAKPKDQLKKELEQPTEQEQAHLKEILNAAALVVKDEIEQLGLFASEESPKMDAVQDEAAVDDSPTVQAPLALEVQPPLALQVATLESETEDSSAIKVDTEIIPAAVELETPVEQTQQPLSLPLEVPHTEALNAVKASTSASTSLSTPASAPPVTPLPWTSKPEVLQVATSHTDSEEVQVISHQEPEMDTPEAILDLMDLTDIPFNRLSDPAACYQVLSLAAESGMRQYQQMREDMSAWLADDINMVKTDVDLDHDVSESLLCLVVNDQKVDMQAIEAMDIDRITDEDPIQTSLPETNTLESASLDMTAAPVTIANNMADIHSIQEITNLASETVLTEALEAENAKAETLETAEAVGTAETPQLVTDETEESHAIAPVDDAQVETGKRKHLILSQEDWEAHLPEIFDVEADPTAETPLITDNIEEDPSIYLKSSPVPWGAGGIGVLSEDTDQRDEKAPEGPEEIPSDDYFSADNAVHGSKRNRLNKPGHKRIKILSEQDLMRRAVQISAFTCILLTLIMGAILYRVGEVQLQPSDQIAKRVDTQRSNHRLFARRGNIVDRRGRLMATSGTAWRLFIDPKLIHDPAVFSEHVGMQLGYDPAMIERKLYDASERSRYVVVDEHVPMDVRWRLSELKQDEQFRQHFRAVNLEKWMQRRYPQGALAGNILGFVGKEGKGLEGVEALYEKHLAAHAGNSAYIRDSRLRPLKIKDVDFDAPKDGNPVVLSIDVRIQSIAEEELAMACQAFEAESAQMVIMNPKTGEILAMANHPTFDPGMALDLLSMGIAEPDYSELEDNAELDIDALELADLKQAERMMPWRNRTISEVFEPGSTFKPFVWAAMTEGGYATPHEMIDCGPGRWISSEGRRLKDAHGVGRVDWTTVLVKSSNIGMAIVAERATHDYLRGLLRRFGFGSPTGSGLMGEEAGLVTNKRNWNHYSQTSVPMGQEIAVTGLQMARALSAIANGGYLVNPTFLKYEADPFMAQPVAQSVALNEVGKDGQLIPADAVRILKAKTSELTLRAMREVILRGTGRKLKDSPYGIFGKTGTAQIARSGIDRKINGPGYEPGAYMACFIGGAPVNDPEIVVVCFVKKPNPKKGYYGGLVAGPPVKKTINRVMPYLGVAEMTEDQEIKRLLPLDQLEQASR